MNKTQQIILTALRRGVLEIRMYSVISGSERKRVNSLADLIHNLPALLEHPERFDVQRFADEVALYKEKFKNSLL